MKDRRPGHGNSRASAEALVRKNRRNNWATEEYRQVGRLSLVHSRRLAKDDETRGLWKRSPSVREGSFVIAVDNSHFARQVRRALR